VEGEALHNAGATSAEILAKVPGVQVVRSGAESDLSTASIRGADSAQTPVYLAGIRLNDDVSGTADLSTIPLWMIDRVEVFRGNASAQADRLGLGGAVFFWPRKPQQTRTGGALQFGSNGEVGTGVAHEDGNDSGGILLSNRRWHADNDFSFTNDFGQRFTLREERQKRNNADFNAEDTWVVGHYRLGRGSSVTAVINAFDRDQGLPGLAVAPADHARVRTTRVLGGISSVVRCAHNSDDCSLELSTSALSARSIISDPAGELLGISGSFQNSQGRRLVQRAGIATRIGDLGTLRVSVQQSLETLQLDLPAGDERRAKREATVPALTSETPIGDLLHLYTLLALECHSTAASVVTFGQRNEDRSGLCAVHEPVGRLGLSLALSSGLEFLGNVGRYVRVPTLGELYGSSALVEGNSQLRPEQGVSADAGLRVSAPLVADRRTRIAVDAFVFSRWADQMIRYQRVSTGSVGPFNVASARVRGAELALALDWAAHVKLETALTALDPRDTTATVQASGRNDILPFTARLVTSSRVELYTQAVGADIERPTLGLSHFYRASRYQDPAGLSVLPEQNFFDLDLSCGLYAGRLIVRASLKNIFDAPSVDLFGLPLPGRTEHLALEAWL